MTTELIPKPTDFNTLVSEIEPMMIINIDSLDSETQRTVRILSDLHKIYNREASILKDLINVQEKITHIRWKYYTGKMDGKYYKENPLHAAPTNKVDQEKYLKADDQVLNINKLVSSQDRVVKYVEDCISQAKRRSYEIRNVIDFRKLVSSQ